MVLVLTVLVLPPAVLHGLHDVEGWQLHCEYEHLQPHLRQGNTTGSSSSYKAVIQVHVDRRTCTESSTGCHHPSLQALRVEWITDLEIDQRTTLQPHSAHGMTPTSMSVWRERKDKE